MANYLNILFNRQFKFEIYFEVLRDFREGGLNPHNYSKVIEEIKSLPPLNMLSKNDLGSLAQRHELTDFSEDDFIAAQRELRKRAIAKSKTCYHPEASEKNCQTDSNGKIVVSAAHSIQNNGILSQIAEEGHVAGINFDSPGYSKSKIGKRLASIFWGFCNKHDSIFSPIENGNYTGTDEQHFLFDYRAFTIAAHKKVEASNFIEFGDQSDKDLEENRKIIDKALLDNDYSKIKTHVFELPNFYPIAVASAFYLDFDYESCSISHSEERMELIFVTLLPQNNRTIFFLSYFLDDDEVYSKVAAQLKSRDQIQLDISILLAPHAENIYFNPTYYSTFIEKQEELIEEVFFEAQFNLAQIGDSNELENIESFTPSNYLENRNSINIFGY